MISCEKQKQPRQSSSSGDFAIIIKMKIRIKPEVSEMMPTFRPIWIGLISPYANYLWPYDSRQRKKNCHGTHIIEFWEKAAHIFVQIKASHVSIVYVPLWEETGKGIPDELNAISMILKIFADQ